MRKLKELETKKIYIVDYKSPDKTNITKNCRGNYQTPTGITLIALVVTIIVLLILAGVAISMTVGNNGLFKRAQNAKEKYEDSQLAELEGLNELEKQLTELSEKNIIPEAVGNIAIGKETWNEGKATVIIRKVAELEDNLKIQYQINGKDEEKWQEGEEVKELAHNDTVYARIWDGTKGGDFIEYTIKDEGKPEVAITLANVTENSITVQAVGKDNETGIETYEFQISESGEEESYETKNTDLEVTNYTFTGLTNTNTYYIRCKVTDVAENQNENAEHTHQILNNSGCSTINRHSHTAQTGSCYQAITTACNGILKCYNWEPMTGFSRHWCRCTVCNREAIIDAWNYGNTQVCGAQKTTGYKLICTYGNGQIVTPSVINKCSEKANKITIKIK